MAEKHEFAGGKHGIVQEIAAFVLCGLVLALLAATHDRSKACSGPLSCTLEMFYDRDYHIRVMISLPVACAIYTVCALIASSYFPREVNTKGVRPPVASWVRWDSDFNWSIVGLIAGSPMIHLFLYASEKYGASSGMILYKNPLDYGLAWAVLQIPVYLLLWDFVFYVCHRWILHSPYLYYWCHAGHHAFRPPTAWSGIAVGPIDVIFEGILPYAVPLYCGLPFNEHIVNTVNALLTFHATVLHSSCHSQYGNLSGILGWLMISPVGHNMHHQYGLKNACNFAPIFKIWDRFLGTLNETEPFWWGSDKTDVTDFGWAVKMGLKAADQKAAKPAKAA